MLKINDYWEEGKYIDLWSINHVLSGVVLGAFLFNFGIPFWWALAFSLLLFILWEVVEVIVHIKEHPSNMITDVVCDALGFLFVAYVYFVMREPFTWMATIIWTLDFLAFNLWGYLAYQDRKREPLPTNDILRAQLQTEQ